MKRTLLIAIAVAALIALALLFWSYQLSGFSNKGHVGNAIVSVNVPVLSAEMREGEALLVIREHATGS